MSKFAKPKPQAQREPSKEDIDRVIGGAEARDGHIEEVVTASPEPRADVRFTMVLSPEEADEVDAARKKAGRMSRLAWIRQAMAEKIARDKG